MATSGTARVARGRERCDSRGPKIAGVRIERDGPLAAWVQRDGAWHEVTHAAQLPDKGQEPEHVIVRWRTAGPPEDRAAVERRRWAVASGSVESFSSYETADTARGHAGRARARQCLDDPNGHPLAYVAHAFTASDSDVEPPSWLDYEVFRCAGRYALTRAGLHEPSPFSSVHASLTPSARHVYRATGVAIDLLGTMDPQDKILMVQRLQKTDPDTLAEANGLIGLGMGAVLASIGHCIQDEGIRMDPATYAEQLGPLVGPLYQAASRLGIRVAKPGEDFSLASAVIDAEGFAMRNVAAISVGPRAAGAPAFHAAVLAHEIGHLIDPVGYTNDANDPRRDLSEIVAETTAAQVGALLAGTPMPAASLWYIANYFDKYEAAVGHPLDTATLASLGERVTGNVGLLVGMLRGDAVAGRFAKALVHRNTLIENWGPGLVGAPG